MASGLFSSGLRNDYKNSHLGITWEFLEPLVYILVFSYLKKGLSLNFGETEMDYALFATLGIMVWRGFSDGIILPQVIIGKYNSILASRNISSDTMIWLLGYNCIFNHCIRMFLAGLAVIYFIPDDMHLFPVFFLIASLPILLGLGLGMTLAPFSAAIRDVNRFVTLSLLPLMFVSDVLFPVPANSLLSYNPLAAVISQTRSVFLEPNLLTLMQLALVSTAIFMLGSFVFSRTYALMREL